MNDQALELWGRTHAVSLPWAITVGVVGSLLLWLILGLLRREAATRTPQDILDSFSRTEVKPEPRQPMDRSYDALLAWRRVGTRSWGR